jgi:hypothetical protein
MDPAMLHSYLSYFLHVTNLDFNCLDMFEPWVKWDDVGLELRAFKR